MSHSQFYYVVIYTQTCMAQSLRQAYDYWQNQPGTTYYFLKLIKKYTQLASISIIIILDSIIFAWQNYINHKIINIS